MKKLTIRQVLRAVNNYIVFFLVVAFAVTCCMMLFLNTLAVSMDLEFTQENIAAAAKITFLNVLLLTFLFGTIDYIRRKVMVDRPVKIITDATEKIMQGDFSVRLAPMHGNGMEGFNQIGAAINKMAEELSGTETLRTDFIANVSHELKTPLAVMGNYATMLQRPGITEEERCEYAKAISEAARKLAQLITNILKLNKLENQQIFPQPKEFDLGEQLCECLLVFEDAWEAKNLEIETDIEDDVRIQSDPELLSLVWNNLISNAVKFTPEGGLITMRLTAEGEYIDFVIEDNGPGIPEAAMEKIFHRFYQLDGTHRQEGNGLGLSIARSLTELQNGTMELTVDGDLFKVTLAFPAE